MKLYPCLSPCIKINSKWIKDLKERPEILKLLQDIGSGFLNRTLKTQEVITRTEK
jgi:hypothetical protein